MKLDVIRLGFVSDDVLDLVNLVLEQANLNNPNSINEPGELY